MKSNSVVSFRIAKSRHGLTGQDEPPTLLSFPFGVPHCSDGMQLQAFEKSTSKKRKFILESDCTGVKFEGCNYGVSNHSNDFSGFSIGVYNESTGNVELYSAGHAFTMQQQGDVDVNSEVPSALSADSMTAMERRQSLTDTFGSKKKKRALRAAESNIISSQNIVAADTISEMLTESIIENDRQNAAASSCGELDPTATPTAPKSAMEQHRETMLPPFDASATALKYAYPLSGGLIPRHVMHLLQEWVETEDTTKLFRQDSSSCSQTVLDIFDLNISQLKEKKLSKGLGSLLLLDTMICLAVQLSETSKPIVKETLVEKLSSPPSLILRHLTDGFAVYKKSFGKGSFVSTKSLM